MQVQLLDGIELGINTNSCLDVHTQKLEIDPSSLHRSSNWYLFLVQFHLAIAPASKQPLWY
jgi:hypothetical protein